MSVANSMKTIYSILLALMTTTLTYAEPTDTIIAKAGPWGVIQRIDEEMGLLILAKENGEKYEFVGSSEDIYPDISANVPESEALELAIQLVRREIEASGGVEKSQADADAQAKQYGGNFFNYLSPLAVQAYKSLGVDIPGR